MDKNELIKKIALSVVQSEDLVGSNWDSLAIVFELRDGAISNSGFAYLDDESTPVVAEIDSDPMLIDNLVVDLQGAIAIECGEKFKQLLLQQNVEGKFKIEFNFDDFERWKISPGNFKQMQSEIRPDF